MIRNKIKKIIIKMPFSVTLYFLCKKILLWPRFLFDLFKFKIYLNDKRFEVNFTDLFPCLLEKTVVTKFEPHYIYHPAWAARVVKKINPILHVDISSTLHFCTILSAFLPVKYYDYRPADLRLDNLISESADLNSLPFADGSIKSLSCMHVVEHVGLGRYGDKLDSAGDLKATKELSRVMEVGGSLIFVVPVGKPKIEFNAHRIYAYEQVIDMFPDMKLKEFSLVPDDYMKYGIINNANKDMVKNQNWGCGCFWFEKK